MNSNQHDLYQRYHDVIVTDNTLRTNKYSMALCLFVVFEQLLNANDKILPTVLISNADTGLDAAVKTFLSTIKHIHYIFHIRQNLDRHIQSFLGKNYNEFLAKFYLAYNSLNEVIFKARWNQLIELFPFTNSYLMEMLDKIKESWTKTFICTDIEQENSQDINDQADRAQISLKSLVMIRSTETQFNISLIRKRWFKLENQSDNDNSEAKSSLICVEQVFMNINGNFSYIDISQSLTVLDILRNKGSMDDINLKITACYLYSDLFELGCKIAQVATEKQQFDVLEVFN
ncbi:19576_t:CDS:2 [Dentiscutata erythropus]|uniref:19576_t:CDS:1 n=1 Tax=Dentiscutata erythropus TaxID=1348616 RepID=A0A9N9BWG5_9GLOM|nr:19576_t:CDS:2 [Dentiscutata erythropus]